MLHVSIGLTKCLVNSEINCIIHKLIQSLRISELIGFDVPKWIKTVVFYFFIKIIFNINILKWFKNIKIINLK